MPFVNIMVAQSATGLGAGVGIRIIKINGSGIDENWKT
jgi:hypothetical protein